MSDKQNNNKTKLEKKIEKWSDEECLEEFSKFLTRVGISSSFIQTEEGLLTHQMIVIRCGDKVITSDPQELDWPLQALPVPDAFKDMGAIN